MTEMWFREAVARHIESYVPDPSDPTDIDAFVGAFLHKFETGLLRATGYDPVSDELKEIEPAFWAKFRRLFEARKADFKWVDGSGPDAVWRIVDGQNISFYEAIRVREGREVLQDTATVGKNKGGRPASEAWPVTTAIAVRIVAENDYPPTPKEFRSLLQAELDRLNIQTRLGEESIMKLVRAIYKHKPMNLSME